MTPRPTVDTAESFPEIREGVRALCANYPGAYWRELDARRGYPQAFVKELTEAGYLAALIPEDYGGSGLPLAAGCAILEEIQKAGCNGARSEEHTSELQSLMRISYAVFCLNIQLATVRGHNRPTVSTAPRTH